MSDTSQSATATMAGPGSQPEAVAIRKKTFFEANESTIFGATRPGQRPAECGRGHCGVDLFDARGTTVHAVADGQVVAVHFAGLKGTVGLGFAIPVSKVLPLLPPQARQELGVK